MILEALQKVFGNVGYVFISLAVSLAVFLFAVWLPNLGLIGIVLFDSSAPAEAKFALPIQLIGSIVTNFSWFSAGYLVLIALLTGINIGLVAYLLKTGKQNQGNPKGYILNLFGMGAGALGVGCAACGSLIVTAVLGAAGGSLIAFLPLKGMEFGVIAVLLLGGSTYALLKKVVAPQVCEIKE